MISHASWQFVNSVFLGGILTSVLGLLPTILSCIAMFLGAVWTSLMIWESKTVQGWLEARRERKNFNTKLNLSQITRTSANPGVTEIQDDPPQIDPTPR